MNIEAGKHPYQLTPDISPGIGRHTSELAVGPLGISVLATSANSIRPEERQVIRQARYAYEKWGGNSKLETVLEDPYDGYELTSTMPSYLTYHFIAWVKDDSGKDPQKIVTMRMIHTINESAQPPDDFTIWLMQNNLTGSQATLDRYIREHPEIFRSRSNPDTFAYPAAISRLGTIDAKDLRSNPHRRIMTPTAFAAIQLVAGQVCQSNFIAAQLRPELKEKYLSVSDREGSKAMMGFTPTLETLGLDLTHKMVLDNSNPTVRELKTHFPGYWLNEALFKDFIFKQFTEGQLPLSAFIPSLKALLKYDSERLSSETVEAINQSFAKNAATLTPEQIDNLLGVITDARFARHLVPLFNNKRIVSLPKSEFQNRMMEASGDGPYPVLMDVNKWMASAKNLLKVASQA